MTKTMTIVVLLGVLVAGAATTAILGRDLLPESDLLAAVPGQQAASATTRPPVSNRESKKDRLAIVSYALAAYEPPQTTVALAEPMRSAYASADPADIGLPKEVAPPAPMAPSASLPAAPPKPKAVVAKPQPQKNYALLSDVQIAGIKDRLKLSASQESYWPPVETALRAVARKIHAGRQTNPTASGVPIDPESAEVQQLKSAAMPLLFQLREDQKNEVRSLARIIGLERVASMI